jgi:flagellar basal body-associated protein FliL
METSEPQTDKKPAKGYGKRSRKQWIIIYVIVAIIVYAIIYFAFIRKSGGTGGSSGY